MEATKQRSIAMDLIRCFAFSSVVGVHFFLNNGYYQQPIIGGKMMIMTLIRTFFMICVPLFIVLSGYLSCYKKLELRYYKGIIRTVMIYVFASAACYVFKCYNKEPVFSIRDFIAGLVNFSAAPYSWYIEMYIGLFFLIPFLNLWYHGLPSGKEKIILLVTLLGLTSIRGYLMYHNTVLLPDWWINLYPVTYYFIGCMLREFECKLPKWKLLLLLLAAVLVFGGFNVYKNYNELFRWGAWQEWGSMQNIITTTLVFLLMKDISFRRETKATQWMSGVMKKLSGWCLGAYLVSYIFDQIFYAKLNGLVVNVPDRLPYFVLIVPVICICSLALSAVLNGIYDGLAWVGNLLINRIPPKRV